MGGSPSRILESFFGIRDSFHGEFVEANDDFERRVLGLLSRVNSESKLENRQNTLETSSQLSLNENDLPDVDNNNQPNIRTDNQCIVIYDKQYVSAIFAQSNFGDITNVVENHVNELNDFVCSSADGSLTVVKRLLLDGSTPKSVGAIVKTAINLACVQSAVGISQYEQWTFVPSGVFVCNLIFTTNAKIGTESVPLSICRTIVCTSTHMLDALNREIGKLEILSNYYCDAVAKLGEIAGWAEAYPNFIKLAATSDKSKFEKASMSMKNNLNLFPWNSEQAPRKGKDVTDPFCVQAMANDFKAYGKYIGFASAIKYVDALVSSDDISAYKDIVRDCKGAINELKSNTVYDYENFLQGYQQAMENERMSDSQ